MYSANAICSLDYLVGTLSTAYKGLITSLATKDFCMSEEGTSTVLRGTVLALPEGNYVASLIRSGVELARADLQKGSFELLALREQVIAAKDLQIDILQKGRHIGTFLLKKEHDEGPYVSAVELSEELKGIDLQLLTVPLRDKVGLLQKAEDIVTRILSTKKEWGALSERLHGFSADLFWSARDAFYNAFPVLARFSLKAAERADTAVSSKPVGNFLDLVDLLLSKEQDDERLRFAAQIWLGELRYSELDLSPELGRSRALLAAVHERFVDLDVAFALSLLLGSLRKRLSALPAPDDSLFFPLKGRIGFDDYSVLAEYGAAGRKGLLLTLVDAEADLEQDGYREVFSFLAGLDPGLLDDGRMIRVFFEAAARSMIAESVDAFVTVMTGFLSLFPALSPKALAAFKANAPVIMEKLVAHNRPEVCVLLLDRINGAGSPLKEEIVMDPGIAAAVLASDNTALLERYRTALQEIVIPGSKVKEISSETWAEVVDPLHIERLAKFLEILQLGGKPFQDILVQVIANIYVSGLFIPDDRLFQRLVTSYLNSKAMTAPFFLNYLLLSKLPVYYNEVGALSRTRDYSTEIDSWGNDPVLYFLRKQVHVNASNYNVGLIEKVIASWVENDPTLLRDVVPRDIYESLKPELLRQHAEAIRPFFSRLGVFDQQGLHFDRLLNLPEEELQAEGRENELPEVQAKIILLCKLYREIVKKYSLAGGEVLHGDPVAALGRQVEQAKRLHRIVLAPEKTYARESLYFKRHIAFGIPSVLGTYHEPKFDALAELLRTGASIRLLLEETISRMDVGRRAFAPSATPWLSALSSSYETLKLQGLENRQIEECAAILQENRLRLSQAADLLRMWQKELGWMVESVTRTFHGPLVRVLAGFPREDLPDSLMNLDREDRDFTDKAADIIIRDMIDSIPGLVEADRMIERLLAIFSEHLNHGEDEVLNKDQQEEGRKVFVLHELPDRDAVRLAPLLGGKAKNLVLLHNRGFRVPGGAVFSAGMNEDFDAFVESNELSAMLRQAVHRIEAQAGAGFGDEKKPLFLSVRSGAYVSMPGILSSILYCGMNRETLQGFIRATGDSLLGWDSSRRFIEHYGTTVLGVESSVFDTIINKVMKTAGVTGRDHLTARHLEEVVSLYLDALAKKELTIPDDVYEQLRQSVRAIYASWFSERAEQFRRATKTSRYWGTAVTLMEMVPGNAEGGGASVFFTRNPLNAEQGIYGETRERVSGDDLVSGRRLNRPLTKAQAGEGVKALEETDPELFTFHRELARRIERSLGGLPQEVEATYRREPDGRRLLFVLQTRRMESGARTAATFDEICGMASQVIARGMGAHGGALSGVASFAKTAEQAARLGKNAGMPVILLRATASTDDVSLMPIVNGIVTASGGVTSHAAVLAAKFGLAAVVACSDMAIMVDDRGAPYARFGNSIIQEGAPISIDGATGLIFSGSCLHTIQTVRY